MSKVCLSVAISITTSKSCYAVVVKYLTKLRISFLDYSSRHQFFYVLQCLSLHHHVHVLLGKSPPPPTPTPLQTVICLSCFLVVSTLQIADTMLLCLKAIADVKVNTFNGILSAAMHEAVNVSLIFLLITQLKICQRIFCLRRSVADYLGSSRKTTAWSEECFTSIDQCLLIHQILSFFRYSTARLFK